MPSYESCGWTPLRSTLPTRLGVDLVGIAARFTHYVKDGNPDSPGTFFVNSMRDWFNSMWKLLAE
ncbi:hypothetical protein GCM10010307_70700 [Streptomyces vastus]|uniref:Uncharacterized protein n=1 Tax=Streptomyces vastus TaxID=285451 RepID=A0ABN3RNC6_9ACTN